MRTSEFLATYTTELSFDDLSEEVITAAQRVLIDSLGCSLGALEAPPVEKLKAVYGSYPPPGNAATVFGTRSTVPVENAALINGAMVRYLDFNDNYESPTGGCHPSDQVPTLLAVAEAEGASGKDLIEAMTVGYEIQCSGVETSTIRPRGWDYVAWGVHGATAAVGKLMGLSQDELVNAFGIAVSAHNALEIARLGEVSMWKGTAQAYGCHTAVHACQMAREGITGPAAVYEGENGFFAVVTQEAIDFEEYIQENDVHKITKTNFKKYPACYATSTAVDAVVELMDTHSIAPEDIESISIESYNQTVQMTATPEKWSTDLSRESADHSMPYVVSIAVLEGGVDPEHFQSRWRQDERVHNLQQKISVAPSEEFDEFKRTHPQSKSASVEIKSTDGTFSARVDYPEGHANNPMTDEQIEEKMYKLARPHLPDHQIQTVIDICYEITTQEDVGDLMENLAG